MLEYRVFFKQGKIEVLELPDNKLFQLWKNYKDYPAIMEDIQSYSSDDGKCKKDLDFSKVSKIEVWLPVDYSKYV